MLRSERFSTCRTATAVLLNFPHCNSSKSVPNRPLRGRRCRRRFGTLLQQLVCGSFETTAVLSACRPVACAKAPPLHGAVAGLFPGRFCCQFSRTTGGRQKRLPALPPHTSPPRCLLAATSKLVPHLHPPRTCLRSASPPPRTASTCCLPVVVCGSRSSTPHTVVEAIVLAAVLAPRPRVAAVACRRMRRRRAPAPPCRRAGHRCL